jgi:hypothetical protein
MTPAPSRFTGVLIHLAAIALARISFPSDCLFLADSGAPSETLRMPELRMMQSQENG